MAFDEALIIMGKAPRPGRVKTRLCPPLSHEDASLLYACLLEDTASEMASLRRVRRYLFLDPPDGPAGGFPYSAFERRPQRGKDLGERMDDAAETAFREGARRVAIVGGDCPALSAGKVRSAFRELREGAGVVFGPTADGGFYLVGLSSADIRPFVEIAWSSSAVLSETAGRCREQGTTFSFLSPERDVDVYEDLLALRKWAGTHPAPACPRTRAWLRAFWGRRDGGSPGRSARTAGPPPGSRLPPGT